MNGDENKNKPIIADKDLPTVDGVKVLKVIRIIIDRDESFYNCVMDDGTIRPISTKEFGEVENEKNEPAEVTESPKKSSKE